MSKGLEIIRKGLTNMPSELVLSTQYVILESHKPWDDGRRCKATWSAQPRFFRAFASQNDAKFELPPPPIYISCTLPTAAPFILSEDRSLRAIRRQVPHFCLTHPQETRCHSREREGFDVEAAKLILVGSVWCEIRSA